MVGIGGNEFCKRCNSVESDMASERERYDKLDKLYAMFVNVENTSGTTPAPVHNPKVWK
jgi:hypothetical protein